jgi:GTPase
MATKENFKSGYVTVAGVPNAGKSSLVNAMVGEPVSIVTAKPQTTRKRTLGILTEPDKHQVVFIDTPGVINSTAGLNPYLKEELDKAMEGIDAVIAAIAPWEFKQSEKPWVLTALESVKVPVIFVSTQADRLSQPQRIEVIERWKTWTQAPLLFTSATRGLGLPDLKEKILSLLTEGPKYYDEDIYTTQNMRQISTEIVRKQCFELLHQEIPYGLAVVLRTYEAGPMDRIEADIVVNKDSHKGMVIGKGGQMLKMIGTRARLELEKNFGKKIFIKLHVIVKPDWIQDKKWLEELGYVGE